MLASIIQDMKWMKCKTKKKWEWEENRCEEQQIDNRILHLDTKLDLT